MMTITYGKPAFLFLFLAALFCAGSGFADPEPAADEQAVREVVTHLFGIMKTDDANEVNALLDRALADARREADEQAIREVISQYYEALKNRDAETMRGLLVDSLTVVSVGESCNVGVIDTTKPEAFLPPKRDFDLQNMTPDEIVEAMNAEPKSLFPPEKNDDWDRVSVSDITVQMPEDHPFVATLSFKLMMGMSDRDLEFRKNSLERLKTNPEMAAGLSEEKQRMLVRTLEEMIEAGGYESTMFALMAKKGGEWKIVAITVPH